MAFESSSSFKIILGSSSSSRRQILSDMGYEFSVMTADIDEKQIRLEKPEELVMALAEAKADAILGKIHVIDFFDKDEPTLLITADQVVIHGGKIREKPSDKDEAREFIKGYSEGHAATVGFVLVTNLKTGARRGGWDKAEGSRLHFTFDRYIALQMPSQCFHKGEVSFRKIPDEVIESLVNEGEVLYVAGGLMVEHPLTSPFVEAMVGTADSIMGLPKVLTERLIQEALQ